MNEIKLHKHKLPTFLLLISILITTIACIAWFKAQSEAVPAHIRQFVLTFGCCLTLTLAVKLFRQRAQITLTVHGVQFHCHTERIDQSGKNSISNQFIAWDDIQEIKLHHSQLTLYIDDNPPDYERLTEIELANLPPREIILYQLVANISGLNVAAPKIANWMAKMKAAHISERSALLLSFYYE